MLQWAPPGAVVGTMNWLLSGRGPHYSEAGTNPKAVEDLKGQYR